MCKIVIKRIGAIKEVNLELNKITLLLGPQSSGKSTISRVLCHCQWIEKNCYKNFEQESARLTKDDTFRKDIEEYYRMEGYFQEDSYLCYEGDFIKIEYQNSELSLKKIADTIRYEYPKLCYIPAERNLVAAIPNLKKYNDTNDLILYFMYDWFSSRSSLKSIDLSELINRDVHYKYADDTDWIIDGSNTYLKLANASSGVQSVLPLYSVVQYVLEAVYNKRKPLSSEEKMQLEQAQKEILSNKAHLELIKHLIETEKNKATDLDIRLKQLQASLLAAGLSQERADLDRLLQLTGKQYDYQQSMLYVEEPEQNLFPDAQTKVIYWLIEKIANPVRNHSLFLTTHSPYILFAANNCLMGGLAGDKIDEKVKSQLSSRAAWISPELVTIYEIHDGKLRRIQEESGLLIKNYLNDAYRRVNNEFLTMLDYYED